VTAPVSKPTGTTRPVKAKPVKSNPVKPVPAKPEPAKPKPVPVQRKVSLAHVVAAAEHDPSAAQGHSSHPADVRPVEAALVAEKLLDATWSKDGSFGSETVRPTATGSSGSAMRARLRTGSPARPPSRRWARSTASP
jgi:hypothetical protein